MKKNLGALGGTFDHFHVGHAHFLDFAAQHADKLVIGITTQALVTEKEYTQTIQSFDIRLQAVRRYCEDKNYTFQLVPLENSVGPTAGELPIDLLIVTQLTQEGGRVINTLRQKKNLAKLPIKVCSMLTDAKKEIISSTRIRKGEINREGQSYWDIFAHDIQLTDRQRQSFHHPLGLIVHTPKKSEHVVVVGDIVLNHFIQNDWMYTLGIYDLKTKRKSIMNSVLEQILPTNQIRNPAGWIKQQGFSTVQNLIVSRFSQVKHLRIEGEEDLLAVAVVMALPLGSLVYYGQPDVGIVEVVVDESLKQKVLSILTGSVK